MKTKTILFALMFTFFGVFSVSTLNAQVTIGNAEVPVSGALLQLKNINGISDDSPNAHLGLALPRVALSDKNNLFPMFLNDANNPNSGANDAYTANKVLLDKTHIGLIVYNITEDDDEELCVGLNKWDGEKWNCFQERPSIAQFEFDCGSVQVFGQYGDGVALNSSNYIRVTLTVTRIGSYDIAATAEPDNGYFFETTGSFLSPGTFTITIPGTGLPVNHTQGADLLSTDDDTPDQFTLTSSGGGVDCNFLVNVISTAARPEFTIDCRGTVVEGMYFEDEPLSTVPNPKNGQSHRIMVTLTNIPPSAYGSIAVLETNTVDGISFRGEAVLSGSTQVIPMIGTGIPRGLEDKRFTITSNSESSTASCQVTVLMLIPRKRLLAVGLATTIYSYNPGFIASSNAQWQNSLNAMLTCSNNFGFNQWSILRFEGFNNVAGTSETRNFISTTSSATAVNDWVDDNRDIAALNKAAWQVVTAATLERWLYGTGDQPAFDIVFLGHEAVEYFRTGNATDIARHTVLANWVKQGGILMITSEMNTSNQNFFRLFFGDNTISTTTGAGPGSIYTLGFNNHNMPPEMRPYYVRDDDPILRGPFEDILGRNWGEDASTTIYLTNLPLEEIVIYSGARTINDPITSSRHEEGVTIFRHRQYPFVFVGDGGFNSSEARGYQAATNICPFSLTNRVINGRTFGFYPTFRLNFGVTARARVHNAVFTANAFAWCIIKAEEHRREQRGSNPNP